MSGKSGFTLVELLIVVAIIGILAAIGFPYLTSQQIKGYNSAAISDLSNFKIALTSYYSENMHYP